MSTTSPAATTSPDPARSPARRTALLRLTALVALPLAVSTLGSAPASAHGSAADPVSRSVACTKNPKASEACRLALTQSPGIPGDWKSIVQGRAIDHSTPTSSPQHRARIADGKLCSAGNAQFSGLDLARDDFPSTTLPGGAEYDLRYDISALHNPYRMEMYVTKDGYDPKKPLKWSDLEDTPFLSADNTAATAAPSGFLGAKAFTFRTVLPEKKGKHLIYTIWHGLKRPDGSFQSEEAFYSCSDVTFK
ncbi:lytic polysaccharide monooxygenase [Streptomyces erythrochromogenes]|uniref:lytic polysaccharide monooxygenase n=1 Tax=Streptomyces erythrochromogenes TaxID=285574 RepID=UPI00386B3A7C|nr:lytic polysaccharide monooxygenase [Streptomyces erythrochromogenes]